jgi:hypothetical protein
MAAATMTTTAAAMTARPGEREASHQHGRYYAWGREEENSPP